MYTTHPTTLSSFYLYHSVSLVCIVKQCHCWGGYIFKDGCQSKFSFWCYSITATSLQSLENLWDCQCLYQNPAQHAVNFVSNCWWLNICHFSINNSKSCCSSCLSEPQFHNQQLPRSTLNYFSCAGGDSSLSRQGARTGDLIPLFSVFPTDMLGPYISSYCCLLFEVWHEARNYFCSCLFCACCLRSETTVPAACTVPGFMFGTLPTKHTLVWGNRKENGDLFLLGATPTLGGCPCEDRPSYKVMVPTWLTGHKYSPHPLNFRSLLCPAQPPWGFVPLLGTGTARTKQAEYQDSTHVQDAIWAFTAEGMSAPRMCTWHNSIYHPWLPWLPSQASVPSFVLSYVLGCAVSAALGTTDRARSEWLARENVADEQQHCTAQEKEGELWAGQRNLLVFCSTWSWQGRGRL